MLRRPASPAEPPQPGRHKAPHTSAGRGLRPAGAFGRAHQFAVFSVCATLTGWSWWSAQSSGYAGLPVNTLGQIAGDLLLMGLVAPLARRAASRSADTDTDRDPDPETQPTAALSPLAALAKAVHRVQLLDVRLCLPQLTAASRNVAPLESSASQVLADHGASTESLPNALSSALANDAYVEILLPDPEESAGLDLARRFGIVPALYRGALSQFAKELGALSAAAESGRLDLRLYAEPSAVSLVRCDRRIWVPLYADGPAHAPDYLALDRAGESTQVLQSYFNRLYMTARSPERARGDPPDLDADPLLARAPAVGAAVACRG